jgi:hypothetical protein
MCIQAETFLCPECGSLNAAIVQMIETVPDDADPWSGILKTVSCSDCNSIIPAHLAERWDRITIDEARCEWRKIYRNTQCVE